MTTHRQVRPRITRPRPQPAYRPRYQPTPADRIARRLRWGVVGNPTAREVLLALPVAAFLLFVMWLAMGLLVALGTPQ